MEENFNPVKLSEQEALELRNQIDKTIEHFLQQRAKRIPPDILVKDPKSNKLFDKSLKLYGLYNMGKSAVKIFKAAKEVVQSFMKAQ